MNARPNSNGSRDHATGNRNETQARFLFFSGWLILLLYVPSGLLHSLLGSGVYFRDCLMLLHLAAGVYWLVRNKELGPFARRTWMLLVPACFILPAFADGGSRVEALTFVKWGALWVDCLVIGRMAGFVPGFTVGVKILAGLTAVLLLADLGTGWYERATGTFVITGDANAQTAFGVLLEREQHLTDQVRVKGLQRDVFSFANLMGMGAVMGLLLLAVAKRPWLRLPAIVWAGGFAIMLITSGGRSAFFGVLASGLLTAGLMIAPEWTRRHYPRIVLGWLLVCLIISFVGVGRLSEAVGGSVFKNSDVGNSMSAYARDSNWAGIMDALSRVPVVLIFGSPLSSVIDPKIDIFYHWADNQFLWLLYHTSVIGFAAMVWFFYTTVRLRAPGERGWARDAMLLFLLFVMGEAIARESMTFVGAMPLFVAIGLYQSALPIAPPKPTDAGRTPPGQRQRRSENSPTYELTRRIQAKLKERQ